MINFLESHKIEVFKMVVEAADGCRILKTKKKLYKSGLGMKKAKLIDLLKHITSWSLKGTPTKIFINFFLFQILLPDLKMRF